VTKTAAARAAARRETAREIAAAYAERSAADEETTKADRERIVSQLEEVKVEQARVRDQASALVREGWDLASQADSMGISTLVIADALGLSRQWVRRYLTQRKNGVRADADESEASE
jgi:hypothetical protein